MSGDYFASGLGYSDMKILLESPAKYRHRIDNPLPPSDAMIFGQLVHSFVLDQPIEVVAKDWDGRTNAGKERAAEVAAQGLTVISADDYERAERVANAVMVKAGDLFTGGSAEVTAHREVDGVTVRARADYLKPGDCIVDLKTTRNADPRLFARDALNYGYQIQAANYIDTFGIPAFTIVAVETRAPYLVSIHQFSEDAVWWGRELIDKALGIYRRCTESGEWPDFLTNDTHFIGRPAWAYDDEIEIPA